MIDTDRLTADHLELVIRVQEFLYREADLLDERDFEGWLDLFADDIRYWMPMRRNMAFRQRDLDITASNDIAWFDDDKETLTKRVKQIMTGVHWAEEPLSRLSHLVTNIRIVDPPQGGLQLDQQLDIKCRILVHRSRLETETDLIVGRRHDRLRWTGSDFRIAQRTIIIDQSVLLAKNLTFFL